MDELDENQRCSRCNNKVLFSGLCTECCESIVQEKYLPSLKGLPEPLPCPFCNQPAELHIESNNENLVFFNCSFYQSCTKNDSFENVEEALKAWNTRGYTNPITETEREKLITLVRSIEKLSLDDDASLALINFECNELLKQLTNQT